MTERNSESLEKRQNINIKYVRRGKRQPVREAEGKRLKRKSADKVSARMDGAGGKWSMAHVELGDNTCLKFIKSHLIGLGWMTDWVAEWGERERGGTLCHTIHKVIIDKWHTGWVSSVVEGRSAARVFALPNLIFLRTEGCIWRRRMGGRAKRDAWFIFLITSFPVITHEQ